MTNFKKGGLGGHKRDKVGLGGSLVEKKVSNGMFSNFGQKDYDFL